MTERLSRQLQTTPAPGPVIPAFVPPSPPQVAAVLPPRFSEPIAKVINQAVLEGAFNPAPLPQVPPPPPSSQVVATVVASSAAVPEMVAVAKKPSIFCKRNLAIAGCVAGVGLALLVGLIAKRRMDQAKKKKRKQQKKNGSGEDSDEGSDDDAEDEDQSDCDPIPPSMAELHRQKWEQEEDQARKAAQEAAIRDNECSGDSCPPRPSHRPKSVSPKVQTVTLSNDPTATVLPPAPTHADPVPEQVVAAATPAPPTSASSSSTTLPPQSAVAATDGAAASYPIRATKTTSTIIAPQDIRLQTDPSDPDFTLLL